MKKYNFVQKFVQTILDTKWKFSSKKIYIFLSKSIFWSHIRILVKNQFFGQIFKFGQKSEKKWKC